MFLNPPSSPSSEISSALGAGALQENKDPLKAPFFPPFNAYLKGHLSPLSCCNHKSTGDKLLRTRHHQFQVGDFINTFVSVCVCTHTAKAAAAPGSVPADDSYQPTRGKPASKLLRDNFNVSLPCGGDAAAAFPGHGTGCLGSTGALETSLPSCCWQ